tara:strand:+ start:685 stop:1911 length:1227 start_codon:yes stop_codon:yes gene_type:complete
MENKKILCSFCGSDQTKVDILIEGDSAYICNNCIIKSHSVINESKSDNNDLINNIKPQALKKELDKYIIGQDQVKKSVSVAVYNHYKRLTYSSDNKTNENMVNIDKSNILFLGMTGTGKTLIAKTLANILNLPFVIVDATVLTEAGYVGEDVDNILVRLYHESGYDIEKTQKGIIYIDEIDKISRKSSNMSITRDVSGEGVQQSLLKIIEGTIANIPPKGGRKHPEQPLVKIDTTNILFICGGTFDGIVDIIKRRIKGGGIGFEKPINNQFEKTDLLKQVRAEDFISYGFIPELMGRLPIITSLEILTEKIMLKILTQPQNSIINQYKFLFNLDNIELNFTSNALKAIVNLAIERKTGARALRAVIEDIMLDIMYDVPSIKNVKSCLITESVVLKKNPPALNFYKKTG